MTTLIVSPAFASHYQPLAVLGSQARAEGDHVVVATGESFRERVLADGFSWADLELSRGHNGGVSRPDEQEGDEKEHLRGFFEATRRGAADTLVFQAARRVDDLLWQPEAVARGLDAITQRLRPDRVITDHVSLTATAALTGLGLAFETFVPGHPSQLPVGDEWYGLPPCWPGALEPRPGSQARIRGACEQATERVAERFNAAVSAIAGSRAAYSDPFRIHGERVLFNYRADLHHPARQLSLDFEHRFLDGCIREERLPAGPEAWVDALGQRPFVYVSLGTFLSARDDVLATIASALREADLPAAIALGSTPRDRIGPIPASWMVASTLPQVALLRHASLSITHGGCNSVVETIAAGVPMVVLPFSTDQFAIAADLERTGRGRCLDPNALTSPALLSEVLTSAPHRVTA
jgi:zeaxanthin glucosyltransferase